MLIKEKILSVLNKGYYSELIKYSNREELERNLEEYLISKEVIYDKNVLRKLSNMVMAEGECVIRGANYTNAYVMTLQNYKSAVMEEIKKTDLSNVDNCYKRRILDVIWNKLYRNYDKREIIIEEEKNRDIAEIFERRLKEVSNENTIIKYAKNTLKKEDGKLSFTIFAKN